MPHLSRTDAVTIRAEQAQVTAQVVVDINVAVFERHILDPDLRKRMLSDFLADIASIAPPTERNEPPLELEALCTL